MRRPANASYRNNLGVALARAGRLEEARVELRLVATLEEATAIRVELEAERARRAEDARAAQVRVLESSKKKDPLGGVFAARGVLVLRSVLLSDERRVAVIGERRVEVGDWIEGRRVVAIELSGVRLRRGHEELVLRLTGGRIKRAAAGRRER